MIYDSLKDNILRGRTCGNCFDDAASNGDCRLELRKESYNKSIQRTPFYRSTQLPEITPTKENIDKKNLYYESHTKVLCQSANGGVEGLRPG